MSNRKKIIEFTEKQLESLKKSLERGLYTEFAYTGLACEESDLCNIPQEWMPLVGSELMFAPKIVVAASHFQDLGATKLGLTAEKTCIPCGEYVRRVKLSVNIEYDYCDGCKQEIVAGYPVKAKPQGGIVPPAAPRPKSKFQEGMPVVYLRNTKIEFYVRKVNDDGTVLVADAAFWHKPGYMESRFQEHELQVDNTRGWMAIPIPLTLQDGMRARFKTAQGIEGVIHARQGWKDSWNLITDSGQVYLASTKELEPA